MWRLIVLFTTVTNLLFKLYGGFGLDFRFRNTILSLGGGRSPKNVFVDFRGREPKPDALLELYGLK